MDNLKPLPCLFGIIMLLLAGCSPKAAESEEKIETSKSQDSIVDTKSFADETADIDVPAASENSIDNAIARYEITLSDDEKAAILEPFKESLSAKPEINHLQDLRAGIEFRIDLREAQLKGDPSFETLLNEHLGSTFTQSDWENTVSSIPDLNTLNETQRKLEEQFPASPEEAIMQAQDVLFQKALTQKLRDEVTKEIVISPSEVEEFHAQYKANSSPHVLYLAKHRDLEAAALELKRDEYWNTWLGSQEN